MGRGRILLGGAAAAVVVALAAPSAFAGGTGRATGQGYPCATAMPGQTCTHSGVAGTGKTVQHHVAAAAAARPANVAGVLPFTGLQLGFVAGVAVLLIGSGLLLRTTGRRRTE